MASSPPYNPPSSGTCNEIVPVGDTNHTSSSSNTTQINEPTTTTNNRSDSEAEALSKLIKADLNSIALGAARGIPYLHSLGPTSPAPSNSSQSSSGSPPTPHPSSSQPSGITVVGTVLTAHVSPFWTRPHTRFGGKINNATITQPRVCFMCSFGGKILATPSSPSLSHQVTARKQPINGSHGRHDSCEFQWGEAVQNKIHAGSEGEDARIGRESWVEDAEEGRRVDQRVLQRRWGRQRCVQSLDAPQ
ncbi:hypothetical protein CsSME_00004781 [Camellia sinensis var. sinensis]